MDQKNQLYFGDNLKILREHVPDASVDLIYLDPPFNSSATYNVLVAPTFRSAQRNAHLKVGATRRGEESAAQITAFEDIRQPTDSGARKRRRCTGKLSRAARASSPTCSNRY
jgi:16S rRNA G966 N2-methylase RsmD